jgi:hypothetical protein
MMLPRVWVLSKSIDFEIVTYLKLRISNIFGSVLPFESLLTEESIAAVNWQKDPTS